MSGLQSSMTFLGFISILALVRGFGLVADGPSGCQNHVAVLYGMSRVILARQFEPLPSPAF